MNYAFLPDLSALAILIVILLLQRRRHRQQQADLWLLGLLLTLIESIAHIFYAPDGIPTQILHVIVVDCYLLAGLVFIWASAAQSLARQNRLLFLGLNALPLLALNTTYGLNIRTAQPYDVIIAVGIIIGLTTALALRRNWLLAITQIVSWLTLDLLVHQGDYRAAVYWSLGCVYGVAAWNFQHRLSSKSTGRLAILTGFTIWSLCFFIHPWIIDHYNRYADIASHVWNMQKSLISIGMILVMLEEQINSNSWLALHDELTGLPNRRLFADRLSIALATARRKNACLALVMLDLNGFKRINDTLGHEMGDQVLREVARRLRENVRSSDTLARLGGDEFILVATGLVDAHGADRIVESVFHALEQPIILDGQVLPVAASVGLSTYPNDGEDAIKLLRIADQRMYATKPKPKTVASARPSRSEDLTSKAQFG